MNPESVRTLEFLHRRGLLSSADLEFGSPTVDETSISHHSCIVSLQGRPRWFVKRGDPVRSHGRDLGMESTVHRLAARHPALAAVVPRCRLIRADGNLLVMEAVSGDRVAPPLSLNSRPDALHAYGAAVGRVHRTLPPRFGGAPWMLSALLPRWGSYDWLPPACGAFLRRLAASREVRSAFDRSRLEWSPACLVHGDLRWANALFDTTETPPRVWLVDWELASAGDPAWDLGSVFADVASSIAMENCDASNWQWVLSLCRPFFEGYQSEYKLTRAVWHGRLERGLRCTGIRLAQTVIELGHDSPSSLLHAERLLLPAIHAFLFDARPQSENAVGANREARA